MLGRTTGACRRACLAIERDGGCGSPERRLCGRPLPHPRNDAVVDGEPKGVAITRGEPPSLAIEVDAERTHDDGAALRDGMKAAEDVGEHRTDERDVEEEHRAVGE